MLEVEAPLLGETFFSQNATSSLSESAKAFQDLETYTLPDVVFTLRSYFYLWLPSQTMFKSLEEVPNIFVRAVRYMPMLIIMEIIGLTARGKKLPRWNHSLMSCCTFLMIFLPSAIIGNIEFTWFSMLYDKYKIVDLAWDSTWTWILCFIAADFSLYLWHRAAHEVNIVWAFHSVHHTPDEVNLLAGYRLPTFNRQIAIFFYLPMAVVFPPGIFYCHYQLNYIYQLWIHTKIFEGTEALGKVFITPSLHRVHHARNRYCIDKNYGAILTLWDHLFGTYAPYRPEIKLSYGLVTRLQSFDPVAVQFKYMKEIYERACTYDNWSDRLSTFFKGPGWTPGKPRLGEYKDIPKTFDDQPYDKQSPVWCYMYITWSLLQALLLYNMLEKTKGMFGVEYAAIHALYIFWTVANSGYFLEHKPWVPASEVARCVAYFAFESLILPVLSTQPLLLTLLRYSSIGSILIWSFKLNMFDESVKKID